MRSPSERADAIAARTRELKRARRERRERLTIGLSAAGCLALVIAAALLMPEIMARHSAEISNSGAAAGVFAAGSDLGYVAIGVLAFVLGCCVTILGYRLHRRNREGSDGRDHR